MTLAANADVIKVLYLNPVVGDNIYHAQMTPLHAIDCDYGLSAWYSDRIEIKCKNLSSYQRTFSFLLLLIKGELKRYDITDNNKAGDLEFE